MWLTLPLYVSGRLLLFQFMVLFTLANWLLCLSLVRIVCPVQCSLHCLFVSVVDSCSSCSWCYLPLPSWLLCLLLVCVVCPVRCSLHCLFVSVVDCCSSCSWCYLLLQVGCFVYYWFVLFVLSGVVYTASLYQW